MESKVEERRTTPMHSSRRESEPVEARSTQRSKFFGSIEIFDMTSHAYSHGLEIKDNSELGLMGTRDKGPQNESREFLIKPSHLEDDQAIRLLQNAVGQTESEQGSG